jgi:hypothetical protein
MAVSQAAVTPAADRSTDRSDDMPDPALFWRWVGKATRPVVGWVLTGIGVLLLLIGYLGISREAIIEKQLPYLISGGIGGLVLVIVGAVFLGTEDLRRDSGRLDRLEEMVAELHRALLVRLEADGELLPPAAYNTHAGNGTNGSGAYDASQTSEMRLVALPSGKTFHRADCAMVAGKNSVMALTPTTARRRALEPCKMCEPQLQEQ